MHQDIDLSVDPVVSAEQQHDVQFHWEHVHQELRHYLPSQAPLKDFIHHNTLHAFQKHPFYEGLELASAIFGYKVSLSLREYRRLYIAGDIRDEILDRTIVRLKGEASLAYWRRQALEGQYSELTYPRVGALRAQWKLLYGVDVDAMVHPLLFRILCSYLDQGISIWDFPVSSAGFLASLRLLEQQSAVSFFKNARVRAMLLDEQLRMEDLLLLLTGDPALFENYLFDQQFAHPGWSGMVAVIESDSGNLLENKKISLYDLIVFELLLEIDALDTHFPKGWDSLSLCSGYEPVDLFAPVKRTELHELLIIWQEAYEWSYYDQVLAGIKRSMERINVVETPSTPSFQALFCIDDRYCSLRRYVESLDTSCRTYGTPGFFGVEFYFQPHGSSFLLKSCPAPVTPRYLIKEESDTKTRQRDLHFSRHSQVFHSGWLIAQTLGFWSAVKLFMQIFRPSMSPATATSLRHMDKNARLSIAFEPEQRFEQGLQVGFKTDEMISRVENVLRSIGLVNDFAPLVYVIGHGASSVNNPHYAAYDCGACSGKAGSVNARVFCHMANDPQVRAGLAARGIVIPEGTHFIGGLHDTTRDEIVYYDEDQLLPEQQKQHFKHRFTFDRALQNNAKERSRRFVLVNTRQPAERIHALIKQRSVSLFEPRPELNHATNALCVIGPRTLSSKVFLDRRSFLNSYDYSIDPDGKYLSGILDAVAPVCGGINLEYYFSRVDPQKLGAGSKLPHNVMGLLGVANGIDGDLRPGLPGQMTEVHDPVRLLVIAQHRPAVVLSSIQQNPATWQWFINGWIWLVAADPDSGSLWLFKDGSFVPYEPLHTLDTRATMDSLLETSADNLPPVWLSTAP